MTTDDNSHSGHTETIANQLLWVKMISRIPSWFWNAEYGPSEATEMKRRRWMKRLFRKELRVSMARSHHQDHQHRRHRHLPDSHIVICDRHHRHQLLRYVIIIVNIIETRRRIGCRRHQRLQSGSEFLRLQSLQCRRPSILLLLPRSCRTDTDRDRIFHELAAATWLAVDRCPETDIIATGSRR